MPRGRRRAARGQAALAIVAVVLALSVPALAAAAQSWSITTSPAAVETGVATDVDVTVTNTSGNNGGGQSIGCVRISIPAAFTVSSASIVSVTNGLSWSVTTSTSGATLVEATAAGDSDRLRGDPDLDVLVLRIRVTGGAIGSYAWAADEFEKPDCSHDHVQPVALPMDVGTGTNDPPLAGDDSYAVLHDHALSVGAPGVLGDDTDPDLDALTAVLDGTTAHGSLTLSPDGSFDYTPDPGFVGTDSFSYHAEDGSASSASATVTIAVDDTAPVAVDDSYSVDRNASLSVGVGSGVLANDTDADPGETLVATQLTGPTDGGLVFSADGSFVYTPDPGFSGTDTFTYQTSDGALTSTATVTIDVVNHAPNAVDDLYAGPANLPLIVNAASGVLANDGDPDGDPLTAAVVSTTTSGVLLLSANGGFTYTPAPGFTGTDQFTYEASDGVTVSVATATLAISNGTPVAVDDVASVIHDRPLIVAAPGVLGNDSDPNGDGLTATMLTGPTSGTLSLDPDGGYTYTPNAGFTGTDIFTYRADDGASTSGLATVTIDVTNAAPVAADDSYAGGKGQPLMVAAAAGVLADDADPDGDVLAAAVASPPSNGSLTLNADGSFGYTPAPGFIGTDTFAYTASDGISTDTATVSITISNSSPVSSDDAFQVYRNRTLTVAASGVLADDVDADGDSLTAGLLVTTSHGTLALGADGGFTYTPHAGYVGSDAFVYRASDGTDTSGPATAHIDVKDRKPVASGEVATVATDGVVTGAAPGLLANDTDPDGDHLIALLGTDAGHGTATVQPDGSWSYAPDRGYSGDDAFTYVAFDGLLTSSPATVRLTIEAPTSTATAQSTPTATPEAAVEPTPTPSPTLAPTPSASPTATPTPTSSPAAVPPAAPPGGPSGEEAFSIPDPTTGGTAGTDDMGLAAAALAGFGSILWAVPSLILSVPGLLLVIAILAQAAGGLAWLPVVRRKVGGFGLRGTGQAGAATRS